MSFSVKTVKSEELDLNELLALYRSAGWLGENDSGGFLPEAVDNSAVFAAAFDDENGRLIGMARALADKASDAYIQDVAVLPEYCLFTSSIVTG